MPRTLKVATAQMDAAPAPTADRLRRAALLVAQAAAQNARIIVLPELFNVGYEFNERNYALAEPIDGQTITWMKAMASQHDIHLVGTFMLRDGDDVFNSAFIVAPDGRTWRYDKIYPFAWERAYFREGHNITIADTELGKFGVLICWDAAHPDLWQRYAGHVDALLVPSCSPSVPDGQLVLPNGLRLDSPLDGSPLAEDIHFQNKDIEDQARWLGVPVIASTGAGQFRTQLPMPIPRFVRDRTQVVLEAGYQRYAKIICPDGQVAARVEADGDGFAVAEVTLCDKPPRPALSQPAMRLPENVRTAVDVIGSTAMIPLYRQGLRREWGMRMAPLDLRTRIWAVTVAGAMLAGYLLGRRK